MLAVTRRASEGCRCACVCGLGIAWRAWSGLLTSLWSRTVWKSQSMAERRPTTLACSIIVGAA